MKIAGKTETLHVCDPSIDDINCLIDEGYVYMEDEDIFGNEIWERETNFHVETEEVK